MVVHILPFLGQSGELSRFLLSETVGGMGQMALSGYCRATRANLAWWRWRRRGGLSAAEGEGSAFPSTHGSSMLWVVVPAEIGTSSAHGVAALLKRPSGLERKPPSVMPPGGAAITIRRAALKPRRKCSKLRAEKEEGDGEIVPVEWSSGPTTPPLAIFS